MTKKFIANRIYPIRELSGLSYVAEENNKGGIITFSNRSGDFCSLDLVDAGKVPLNIFKLQINDGVKLSPNSFKYTSDKQLFIVINI